MTISYWHYLLLAGIFVVFGLFSFYLSRGNPFLLGLALVFILIGACIIVSMVL